MKELLSKKRLTNALGVFGKLRVQVSHGSILSMATLFLIIFIAFAIRILPIRWEIPAGTLNLGEFDSYYYYSATQYMVQHGLLSPYLPHTWVNYQLSYPFGYDMGDLLLPTLPTISAISYGVISFLGVHVDLLSFCSVFAALLGTLTVLFLYFVGKDFGGKAVGLLSALFLALLPSVIERTGLGWFETEPVGLLGFVLFILFFFRAIDPNRSARSTVLYSIGAGLAIAFFTGGWGAAYFVFGLTAIFVFVLILLKRQTHRLLFSYSITFGLGLFLTTLIPYFSVSYLLTAPVLAITGVFALLIFMEVWHFAGSTRAKLIVFVALVVLLAGALTFLWTNGVFTPIAGKFFSVIDPYVRSSNPILASVAEHQVTSWGDIYLEYGVSILFFLLGLYFIGRNPTNKNVFLLIFALTALYSAASMVRILVLFGPAFALVAALGVSGLLKPFTTLLVEAPKVTAKAKRRLSRVGREYSGIAIFLVFIILVTNIAFSPQSGGVPRVYSTVYAPLSITGASLPVAPSQPVTAWLDMLKYTQTNLQPTSVVCAWWDYGFWLTYVGNVTTLCDNTTENTTQIENVGFAFMANETQSLNMLATYTRGNQRVDYMLVFITVALGQGSTSSTYVVNFAGYGDEGKWSWMAQISGGAQDRLVRDGFIPQNESWNADTAKTAFGQYSNVTNSFVWSDQGTNSTVYKLMSYAKEQWTEEYSQDYGLQPDTTVVAPTYFNLTYLAGLDVSPVQAQNYGGLVPLVALYKINWDQYYNDTSTTG